ncbi:MAG TPA: hypothetical protein VLJ15_06295 [Gammaproteobacteria bacterium]|nr:hypothetical protein [Gammaproteobacteria bacterium]
MKQIKRANQFSLSLFLAVLFMGIIGVVSYSLLNHFTIEPFFAKERNVYISCILALLPVCLMSVKLSTRYVLPTSITMGVISIGLLCWLVITPAFLSIWRVAILFGYPVLYGVVFFKTPFQQLFIFAFVYMICIVSTPRLLRNTFKIPGRRQGLFWLFLLTFSALLIFSQSISGLAAVGEKGEQWYADFEPVLYSISQVVGGKTLLSDLSAQYGLYAEWIAPLFRIIGFSLFKVTFLFALMEAVAFLALTSVFFKLSRSILIRLCWVASCMLLFGFAFQNYTSYGIHDPYYQYFPIRLFFPAISVFLFWKWISGQLQFGNTIAFSLFLTAGVIWNLDSGIPALGSFFVYLLLSIFFTKGMQRKQGCKILGVAMLSVFSAMAFFVLYLSFKADTPVMWGDWIRFQRLYYGSGLFAMPLFFVSHPWMVVIIVYMIGIIGYMRSALENTTDCFWKLMLYLSVLGLGLFAYYQHRSSEIVFMAVIWPALFMAYAGVERFISYIIHEQLPKKWMLAVVPVLLIGFAFCSFLVYKAPAMMGLAVHNWHMAFAKTQTPVFENMIFMRNRISEQDRQSVVIISKLQALYFGELGMASSIKGPGIAESFLPEEQAVIVQRIRTTRPSIIFLQDEITTPVFDPGVEKQLKDILKKEYKLIESSPYGMQYFRARRQGQSGL